MRSGIVESMEALVSEAERTGKKIGELVLEYEAKLKDVPRDEVWREMERRWRVMKDSVIKATAKPPQLPFKELTGMSRKVLTRKPLFLGSPLMKAVARSMAVAEYNASMGRICAAPTAGSAGILPAVLYTVMEEYEISEDSIVLALFTAGGIGLIIANRASISGAEAGCQAECGVASAMAAGALVELFEGSPRMVADAVAIALKNLMGLICDPVAGLVVSPCIKRNAIGVMNAFLSAEMALAGVKSLIPCDEVIDAMGEVGRKLPLEFKETGLGGIAATPTAEKLKKSLTGQI
ncbi:MAG: L-serine ammonia-lyase, iron-sulfur-dependent, subunit alpha [Candidatus Baldrarchaeia archaeon]